MGKKWEKQGEKGGKGACQLCLLNLCKYLPMFCLVLFSESISKCHTHTLCAARCARELCRSYDWRYLPGSNSNSEQLIT